MRENRALRKLKRGKKNREKVTYRNRYIDRLSEID
jgi:hypothetical protein